MSSSRCHRFAGGSQHQQERFWRELVPCPGQGYSDTNSKWCSGLEHSSLLSANFYYSEGWKTGTYPKIAQNVIHLQARPHPKGAKASSDSVGEPAGGSTGGDSSGPSWVGSQVSPRGYI